MELGLWLLLGLTVTSAAGKQEGRGGVPLHAGVHTKGSQARVCVVGKLVSLALQPEVAQGRVEGPEDRKITSTESGSFQFGRLSLGTFQRLYKIEFHPVKSKQLSDFSGTEITLKFLLSAHGAL